MTNTTTSFSVRLFLIAGVFVSAFAVLFTGAVTAAVITAAINHNTPALSIFALIPFAGFIYAAHVAIDYIKESIRPRLFANL
jgi:hypothetical protein